MKIEELIYQIDNNNYVKYGIVPWDSEIFGFNVVEITDFVTDNINNFDKMISSVETYAKDVDTRVICTKVPSINNALVNKLQRSGYIFVEETIKPYLADLQNSPVDLGKYIKIQLRDATEKDAPDMKNIAKTTFTTDRFHLDEGFNKSRAGERYAVWIENSFKYGDKLYVLEDNNDIAGFFIIRINNDDAYYVLAGIKDEFKGKGYGINLYASMMDISKKMGTVRIDTLIAVNNISALNIYVKLGFKFRDNRITLHKWL